MAVPLKPYIVDNGFIAARSFELSPNKGRLLENTAMIELVRRGYKQGQSLFIKFAGGLKESVYPVAYIFRSNLFNPVEMKYIRIELEKSGDVQLQPGDQLNIYDNATYTNVGELRISGAVKNQTGYTFETTVSKTLSVLTSTLLIILLVKSLNP